MNKRALGADGLLLITAAIWGCGFVAQRSGMEYLGPFAYNGIRFVLGSLSLFPVIFLLNRKKPPVNIKKAIPGILAAGCIIFIAVTLQQLGIMFTTAGNAGFITGLYVVLTPFFGIFLGRKTGRATWLGALLMLAGLFFVSIVSLSSQTQTINDAGPGLNINPGDMIIVVSAIFWAFHVLIIDRLVQTTDPIILSSGQFLVCGIFSLVPAFFAEPSLAEWLKTVYIPNVRYITNSIDLVEWIPFPALLSGLFSGKILFDTVKGALVPVLFGGLASVGIAYTLQVVAQKNAPPAHATIILCLEGFFAALGGVIILNEPLGTWTVLGFALMMGGMLISQWEVIFAKGKLPSQSD